MHAGTYRLQFYFLILQVNLECLVEEYHIKSYDVIILLLTNYFKVCTVLLIFMSYYVKISISS